MKRVKLMLAMLSVSVLLACVGVFAACGDLLNRKEDDETTYYIVTAVYDKDQGTVALTDPASEKGYVKDEQVTVTVTPAADYEVGEVKVNGEAVALTENKYTFKVAGDTIVSATFTDTDDTTYYTVTATYEQTQGTVTVSPAAKPAKGYVAGEQVTITVAANTDYKIGTVTVNEQTVTLTAENTYTFAVAGNTTIAVTFQEVAHYTVTVSDYDDDGGTVRLSDPASTKGYAEGEQVTVTVTANEDYTIGEVKVNGETVHLDSQGQYTFAVAGETTVAVTFHAITYYNVTVSQYDQDSGTVTVSPAANPAKGYVENEQVTITVTAAEEHAVSEVKVNDVPVGLDDKGEYTFPITQHTTVSVTFVTAYTYYTVTVMAYNTDQGTVEVSEPAEGSGNNYRKAEQVTLTVTAKANYTVGEVIVNGASVDLDSEGKYEFSITQDTTISVKFVFADLRSITWTDSGYNTTAGLGTLKFDEDYNMTLTPPGGDAQPVTITTAGVDLSKGLPDKEIQVKVGTKSYTVTFGAGITFTEGYTEHVFDSPAITDFTPYKGTWKQYNSTNELEITAEGFKFLGNTYSKYYTAPDGSYYIKYQMTASTRPQRYPFGYFDNAKQVVYINLNGSMYSFTSDGNLPKATLPAEFYGEWWNQSYYGLSISAKGASIDGVEVSAFVVSGDGAGAIIHAYYNKLYHKFYLQKNATSSEYEVVMDNGTIKTVFTAVKPEPLPAEYRGNWTQLVGDKTLFVGETGKITYEGAVYEVTRDSRDFGFHFTTAAGTRATLMYFENSGVLALDDGDGHIFYYAKVALSELGDVAASGVPEGTWTSGEWTITVSADHKVTLSKNGEEAKAVRIVFGEDNVMIDDQSHYNGEAIYDGVYYEFDYNKVTGAITLTKFTDFGLRTTEELAFTKTI